ncbi:MAG: pyridoxamine 5'-phosphate oxidase family protein [Candidatus Accumulibacter sp.]|jgi:nitroimidazol reductase NimA-like FMN-containing flavoprotein (pyridoxamine 5'-phosphate oxidase superfamily)|nr:pyridoxamine 5'-phosphate oxidase family protein [Accumulibacter sp.]
MRRAQCELHEVSEIEAILLRGRIGVVATHGADGYPYATPVNYVYRNGSVYFHGARQGEKVDNIRRDSRVCFTVALPLAYKERACDPDGPPCSAHQFYHSAILRGRAEMVEAMEEKLMALNALLSSHENRPDGHEVTADMPPVDICAVMAIRVESMTGKSDFAQKKSPEDKRRIAAFLRQRGLPGDIEAARLMTGTLESEPR